MRPGFWKQEWIVSPQSLSTYEAPPTSKLKLISHCQSHPVDQDIVCKDCKQQFTRASAYVWHIESGRCSKNLHSHQQLEAQRQHKHILKQILNKPEDFNFRVESAPGPDIRGSDGEDDDYERAGTTGGVSLTSAFDDDDEQKKIAYEPLRPNLGDLIAFESKPQWPTPFEAGGPSERKDPVAKAIEYNQNWEAALANKDRSYQEDNAANLMHSHNARIYNPESQSYDPYRFWDAQLQAFRCPYAECDLQADQNFDSAADIKEHMVQAHTVTRIRCPSCLKHFGSSAALIAHAETAVSSCGLKNGRNFGQIIDELSGGFLALKTEDGENKTPMFEATKPSGGW